MERVTRADTVDGLPNRSDQRTLEAKLAGASRIGVYVYMTQATLLAALFALHRCFSRILWWTPTDRAPLPRAPLCPHRRLKGGKRKDEVPAVSW
ncbi:hypothetical protein MRX96_022952 [Rhipicephalus microplus]